MQRIRSVLAVDLTGRGDEYLATVLVTLLQDDVTSPDICLKALQGSLHDQVDADRSCKMKYAINAANSIVDHVAVQNRPKNELDIRVACEVTNVLVAAGGQIIQDEHFVAIGDEFIHQVRADEPGTAGDERSHCCPLCSDSGIRRDASVVEG